MTLYATTPDGVEHRFIVQANGKLTAEALEFFATESIMHARVVDED